MNFVNVCCINCKITYRENDPDIIYYMQITNDTIGWCDNCIRDNLECLKENNKFTQLIDK